MAGKKILLHEGSGLVGALGLGLSREGGQVIASDDGGDIGDGGVSGLEVGGGVGALFFEREREVKGAGGAHGWQTDGTHSGGEGGGRRRRLVRLLEGKGGVQARGMGEEMQGTVHARGEGRSLEGRRELWIERERESGGEDRNV